MINEVLTQVMQFGNAFNLFTLITIFIGAILVFRLYQKFALTRAIKGKKRAGDNYERRVGKHYENIGYKVDYRGLNMGVKDGGIDLIATKGEELVLIQCKFWTRWESITHSMVKEFYGNCHFYLDHNPQLQKKNILCIYAVPNIKSLGSASIFVFKNNHKRCRYKIIA